MDPEDPKTGLKNIKVPQVQITAVQRSVKLWLSAVCNPPPKKNTNFVSHCSHSGWLGCKQPPLLGNRNYGPNDSEVPGYLRSRLGGDTEDKKIDAKVLQHVV